MRRGGEPFVAAPIIQADQPGSASASRFAATTIKDGSFLNPDFADASFRGFGVNTEAGVTVFATPRIGISAGYRYRSMWFDSASGVSREALKLRPRFRETSGSVAITGLFAF